MRELKMFMKLGNYDRRLRGIYAIIGVGLTSNTYVIGERRITLIDTGNGAKANSLIDHFQRMGLNIENIVKVILTHSHHDHIGGLMELSNKGLFRMFIHEAEAHVLGGLGCEKRITRLKGGERIEANGCSFEVIHTPGHSKGSICLYDRKSRVLFSGDTVFSSGFFGRCDLEGGDPDAMIYSLKKLTQLDVDILLPGHEELVFQDADKHIRLSYRMARRSFKTCI